MDDSLQSAINLTKGMRQKLESLQKAGVSCISKVHFPQETKPPSRATEPIKPRQQPPRQTTASPPRQPSLPTTADLAESKDKAELLKSLQEQVKVCALCRELANTRTQTVFGVGNPDARLCFFGEAPGAEEDRLGEPFVGRAGQLLDKIINACGMKRQEVYILNVLRCRPPGNRNPTPDEASNCRPFYERQIEIVDPEFIVCLGKVAASDLLDSTLPIGRLRGHFHTYRNAKVIATYHPSYLLRNPSAKKYVWEDMKMLLREMGLEIPR